MHRQFLCYIHCVNFQAVSCRPQSAVLPNQVFSVHHRSWFSALFCRHQSPSLHRQAFFFGFFFIVRILLFCICKVALSLVDNLNRKAVAPVLSHLFKIGGLSLYGIIIIVRVCQEFIRNIGFYIKLRVAFKGEIFGANVEIIRDFSVPTVVVPR